MTVNILELKMESLLNKFTEPFSIKVKKKSNGTYDRIQIADVKNRKHPVSGVYIFWWTGSLDLLRNGNLTIKIKGNRVSRVFKEYYNAIDGLEIITKNDIEYLKYTYTWKIDNRLFTKFGYPLYVGKSTNINRRIGEHILPGTVDYGKITDSHGFINKKTTACQLRSHLEFIFADDYNSKEILGLMMDNVKVSYFRNDLDKFGDRFYMEDTLIGGLQSMFNVDSER